MYRVINDSKESKDQAKWKMAWKMRNWVTFMKFMVLIEAKLKIRNLICLHFQRGFRNRVIKRPRNINVLFFAEDQFDSNV